VSSTGVPSWRAVDTPETRLEAALAASWDRDTLAVYADYLVERGDPRGELIAIDLLLEQRSSPDLVARRATLLTAWLGKLVPNDPHTPWIGDSFRFGFVDDLVLDGADPNAPHHLATMLASPLAPYLKRVTVRGDREAIAMTLRTLARDTHRWLSELVVDSNARVADDEVVVDAETIAALIAATPQLRALDVAGTRVAESFAHPALRDLRVTGAFALPALFDGSLEAVIALDFKLALAPDPYAYDEGEPPRAPQLQMAALRKLDLSRNVPAQRYAWVDEDVEGLVDDDVADPLVYLGSLAARRQLTHLALPVVRDEAAFMALQAIVDGMPMLEEIVLRRAHYYRPPELKHPRAKFVRPAPWPWPKRTTLANGEQLSILVPGTRSGDEVTLDDAIEIMEQRFEDLPADARYAWTRFWVFVGELRSGAWKHDDHHAWTEDKPFPADLLVAALEACDIGGSGGWRELRDQLRFRRPYPTGAVVTVHCRR
jgi:uncharacterized protein (TIGR02996 family)